MHNILTQVHMAHTHTRTHARMYTHANAHAHAHVRARTHTHTHIHTHTHTHTQVLVDPGFGEDVRLQPPSSPPSPPRRKHASYVEGTLQTPRKISRVRHSSEPPTG